MPAAVGTAAASDDSKRRAARETIDILHEISTLLVRSGTHASTIIVLATTVWALCSLSIKPG